MTKLKSVRGAECLLGENPSKELLEAMGAAMMKHYEITPQDVARYASGTSHATSVPYKETKNDQQK